MGVLVLTLNTLQTYLSEYKHSDKFSLQAYLSLDDDVRSKYSLTFAPKMRLAQMLGSSEKPKFNPRFKCYFEHNLAIQAILICF